MLSRRSLLTSSLSTFAFGVTSIAQGQPLRFLLEKDHRIALNEEERYRLTKATLDTLESHYKGTTLQIWKKPFEQIDFEKRLTNIVYWVNKSIQEHQKLHIVDPVWVISQIMAESLFCEFAISNALAAGICQFMPRTAAIDYGMLIAGTKSAHYYPPYLKTEYASALQEYDQLVKLRGQYRKTSKDQGKITLNTALKWLAEGKTASVQATEQIERNKQIDEYTDLIRDAKKNYRSYLETNIQELGKGDLFNNTSFFAGFDERFTYQKPINAMVHMLANALRVRGGNMLAAAAAYNAGLSRTWTNEALYSNYGKFPNIAETSNYLSRIVANYEEISDRFYG
jgi:hypothetical protein